MALLFEYCFYVGVLLILVSCGWLLRLLAGRQWRRSLAAIALLLVGATLIIGPAIISRSMEVDLGPRDAMVNGERHLTLTGWNGDGYDFLTNQTDVVVLQMGNPDVTDATLQKLSTMDKLRELDLNDTGVSDQGLRALTKLPALETLRLRGTKITDEGFRAHMMDLPKLRQLDVRATSVTPDTIEQWKQLVEGRRAFQ